MKVLAINASPHKDKGNTALILNPFLEGMKEAGADVELFYARDLTVKPCEGCFTCWFKTPGRCIHDDDMRWLIPKMNDAEIHVIASPVYGWGVTGPMKTLTDRMVSRVQPFIETGEGGMRHLAGTDMKTRQVVLVSNCGFWEMDNFDPLLAQFHARCAHGTVRFAGGLLRPHGPALRGMIEQGGPVQDVPDAAREAGRRLVLDGSIPEDLLKTIARPLLPKDVYLQIANEQFTRILGKDSHGVAP